MSVNQEFEKTGSIAYLCDEYLKNNFIDPEASERLGVKRGLRNPDGTGVLAGLTNVCDVVGYDLVDGKRVPTDGKLIYRGIDVEQIVRAAYAEDRYSRRSSGCFCSAACPRRTSWLRSSRCWRLTASCPRTLPRT